MRKAAIFGLILLLAAGFGLILSCDNGSGGGSSGPKPQVPKIPAEPGPNYPHYSDDNGGEEMLRLLSWPFTSLEYVLARMAGVDIDKYGYGQQDTVYFIKRIINGNGTPSLPTTPVNQRQMFTSVDGEHYAKYQKLLDQEAEMIRLWLEDKATVREGEHWQHHYARIAQTEYIMTEAPGLYSYVESGRRVSVLGSSTFAGNADAQTIMEFEEEIYPEMFNEFCYLPGKAVQQIIEDMDPTNRADVNAARIAYDELDFLARSCVMNYQLLTRAEDPTYVPYDPDAATFTGDKIPANLTGIGRRKPTGAANGNYVAYSEKLEEIVPDVPLWYIWISAVSSGQMRVGTSSWDEVEASGVLRYPREYYSSLMGISLTTDNNMNTFFDWLDANRPNASVYLQVENMNRAIEPMIDVMAYAATKWKCVKGFAIDVEWYLHSTEDCGLRVSDYRGKRLNEYIYKTWNEVGLSPGEYGLVLKHYDVHHLPDTYRGNEPGKSNYIIFCDDTQNYGSWDGSHGGRYNEAESGNGSQPANGGDWTLFAQFVYPAPVIFQTGYQHDPQWAYAFEDPLMRTYAIKSVEVCHPKQSVGVAWVNFNDSGFREFPFASWSNPNSQLGELNSRILNYLANYNGNSNNLTGGVWGYFSNAAGARRNQENNPLTLYDALAIRHTRIAYNTLTAAGATNTNWNNTTPSANYAKFMYIESRAVMLMIDALPDPSDVKPGRDLPKVQRAVDAYHDLIYVIPANAAVVPGTTTPISIGPNSVQQKDLVSASHKVKLGILARDLGISFNP